jgi:hypothetical protein
MHTMLVRQQAVACLKQLQDADVTGLWTVAHQLQLPALLRDQQPVQLHAMQLWSPHTDGMACMAH